MDVKLTKTGHNGMAPMFGSLDSGTTLFMQVANDLSEADARARALQALKRSNPDENTMEWQTEVLDA